MTDDPHRLLHEHLLSQGVYDSYRKRFFTVGDDGDVEMPEPLTREALDELRRLRDDATAKRDVWIDSIRERSQ